MAVVTIDDLDGCNMADTPIDSFLEIRPEVRVGDSSSVTVGVRTIDDASVTNHGSVMAGGPDGIGIDASADAGVVIHNTIGGQIFGARIGIDLGGGNRLFNAGTITGGFQGVAAEVGSTIDNLGTIGANLDAVLGFETAAVETAGSLNNYGTIYGLRGVILDGNGQILINTGTILGTSAAVQLGTGSIVRNWGTIQGNVNDGTEFSAQQIFNYGLIEGTIDLGAGNDQYDGFWGDVLGAVSLGDGNDTALGGAGNEAFVGGEGNDILNGGEGTDTAIFISVGGNKIINLTLTGPQVTGEGSDTLIAIENVVTLGGNDQIIGNAGNNMLHSGSGNDTLTGGAGDDAIIGGEGSDTAVFTGAAATVNLSTITAQNTGHGLDTLQGVEHLLGGAGNDSFTGNALANLLNGAAGNDSLSGGLGNDTLLGQVGNDTLFGQGGSDVLVGGAGNDLLIGGVGQDAFLFDTAFAQAGLDRISDFVAVDDTIRLKRSVFTALPLPLGQLSPNAFRLGAVAQEGDDRILYDPATGALRYDADGSGAGAAVHFATLISKPTGLGAGDFLVV